MGFGMGHYIGLIAGYGVAMIIFWALWGGVKPLRRALPAPVLKLERPWLELSLVLLAAIGVIAVGQLYIADRLLPDRGELLQSLNQLLIFAPLLILLFWRGNIQAGAFLPWRGAAPGLALGFLLAGAGVAAYVVARGLGGVELNAVFATFARPDNISYIVQIFLQDLAIAAVLARLMALSGWRLSLVLIAILFQLAHIPPFLAGGATLTDLGALFLDTGIGLLVFGAIIASRSIWWFWPLHTAMDLLQFQS